MLRWNQSWLYFCVNKIVTENDYIHFRVNDLTSQIEDISNEKKELQETISFKENELEACILSS